MASGWKMDLGRRWRVRVWYNKGIRVVDMVVAFVLRERKNRERVFEQWNCKMREGWIFFLWAERIRQGLSHRPYS